MIDSAEVYVESIGRRVVLTATRPDLANDKATFYFVCEQADDPAIAPFSPTLEEELVRNGFRKSLDRGPHTYCHGVVHPDDRHGIEAQFTDLFGSEYLLGRAGHLLHWATDAAWKEERSFQVSPLSMLGELKRDLKRARLLLDDDNNLREASSLVRRASGFIKPLEWELFRRCYLSIVGSPSVDAAAAKRIHDKVQGIGGERRMAFQVSYGPEYLTLSCHEVIPEWVVISVVTGQARDKELPFFEAKTGIHFVAKNFTPPMVTGVRAPRGALQFRNQVQTLQEGYTWVATKALAEWPEPRSFSKSPEEQYVKLLSAPKKALVAFI